MPGDVNRLMSMINQANLPYQVFEEAAAPPPVVVEVEACVDFLTVAPVVTPAPAAKVSVLAPANEDVRPISAGFFGGYSAAKPVLEAPPEAEGESAAGAVLLSDLFGRMASSARIARAAS